MKYIQAVARADPEAAPPLFNLLANAPEIDEARVLDVNTTLDGVDNYLFAIDGDAKTFAEKAPETVGVESVELTAIGEATTYAMVVVRALETPMYDNILRASSQNGLIIRTPIVYRDGAMYGHGVGDPKPLQDALDAVPPELDIQFNVVGEFRGERDVPSRTLSDRQREAVEVALDLGYYDQPRGATHDDIAAELGCASATASDHLQKAEEKLVRAGMKDLGRDR